MPEELLTVRSLVCGYGQLRAINGVSMKVLEGEAVALLGSNGAGKTTLLRAIIALVSISSGEIWLGRRLIGGLPSQQIAGAGVALVPEGREVFTNLTVEENLVVGGWVTQARNRSMLFEEVYGLFPRLRERRNQKAGTLSGGEQQMLAIGRALMSGPRLLLVDEPSMGLGPILVRDLYEVLRQINHTGTAILLVEQNVRLALGLCSRGYVMERGSIALHDKSEALRGNSRVVGAYLGMS